MFASRSGDADTIDKLLKAGAEPACADDHGVTPLMLAAASGSEKSVQLLLDAGAPWNDQDKGGFTAGEYASASGQLSVMQQLLNFAVRAELILGTIQSRYNSDPAALPNEQYLKGSVEYMDDQLIDAGGEGVMMEWERSLMEKHAEVICQRGGNILNVGFGMGIIDSYIQVRLASFPDAHHYIIEAHPVVHERMKEEGWLDKANVTVLFGRWQDVIGTLPADAFGGIFFDTYGEYYEQMREFHSFVPRLLKKGGIYSFFNGLAPDNMFFHLVYGEIVRKELHVLGLTLTYEAVPVDKHILEDKTWKHVNNRYWHLPLYFVPTCVKEE